MKISNTQVFGFESALRGMRNPKNSWDKSDSKIGVHLYHDVEIEYNNIERFELGEADAKLSSNLTRAGSEHCKHLRMIQVWFDLDVPRYLWQEIDTYRFVEKISCSTMHKMFHKELELEDFEIDENKNMATLDAIVNELNVMREYSLEETNQVIKEEILIQAKTILPESFLQLRTVNTNYQQLMNIYLQRKDHRLPLWQIICKWIIELPYFKELTGIEIK